MSFTKFTPCAYIFTDEALPRYVQTYANTFYEELSVKEAFSGGIMKASPTLYDAAVSLWHTGLCRGSDKIFVIYRPSMRRLKLATVADNNRPILLIDTKDKAALLRRYRIAFEKVGNYRAQIDELSLISKSLRFPNSSKASDIDLVKKRIQFQEGALLNDANTMMDLLLAPFRRDILL